MKRTLLTPRRMLALIVVLLVVSSFLGEGVAEAIAGGPRNVVSAVTSPFTSMFYALGTALRHEEPDATPWNEQRVSRAQLEREYGLALKRLDYLQEKIKQLEKERARYANLRAVAEGDEQLDLSGSSFINARVTAFVGEAGSQFVTIDRGTRSGIREGTVIIQGDFNLVGKVVHAGPVTADVKIITSPGTRLEVRLVPATVNAGPQSVRVQLHVRDDGKTFETQVETDTHVQVNDLAHLVDNRWPREAAEFRGGKGRVRGA